MTVIPAPTLLANQIHVWRIELAVPLVHLPALQNVLSPEEIQRSLQFHFERDRKWFELRRGSLRHILGLYTGEAPGEIRFHINEYGKPQLFESVAPEASMLHFSLTHSQGVALCAIARGREVGVDLERLRPLDRLGEMVAHCFSTREQTAFEHLPEKSKPEGFFALWTRKEAYVKARGYGLSYPLEAFTVHASVLPSEILMPVQDPMDPQAKWGLLDLSAPAGYRAALAAAGMDWRVQRFSFN